MDCVLHINKNMDIFIKNGWLTVGWSYLLHKNIEMKYMIGSPEEVESNIIKAASITVKIYKIKMDMYFNNVGIYMITHLMFMRIFIVFDMYRI